ncbi:MAG: molybdopterin converting factor subunit 1 [Dehalococcoidia bacterium]
MNIRVRFFAIFYDLTGRRELNLKVRQGLTVGELHTDLCARFPRLADYRGSLMYSVNAEYVPADYALGEGDEVAFIPPVSGGTDAH